MNGRGRGVYRESSSDAASLPLLDLLKRTSRAFYLTIRVLPRDIREPVGLAYLLARAADTIADTRAIPGEERLEYLLSLRDEVGSGVSEIPLSDVIDSMAAAQPTSAERDLLSALPQALELLASLPSHDREMVSEIVVLLTEGMEFDLTRFPGEGSGEIVALDGAVELDHYTYLVAGCVGEFWTDVTMAHTPALAQWDRDRMAELGVRFGKALQMTNVLRDVPSDLRIGRCYLPSEWLDQVGLVPTDLLDPGNSQIARPVIVKGIAVALEHFEAAENYLLSIPRRCVRLRLAAAWPLLMGLATLAELARNRDWLNVDAPSKVSRGWVYRTMARSFVVVHSNRALRSWIHSLRRDVESSVADT